MTNNFSLYVTSATKHNASLLKLKFLNRIELSLLTNKRLR